MRWGEHCGSRPSSCVLGSDFLTSFPPLAGVCLSVRAAGRTWGNLVVYVGVPLMTEWWRASSLVFTAILISPLEIQPFLWVFPNSVPWPQECSHRTKMDTRTPYGGWGGFQMSAQIGSGNHLGKYRITQLFQGIDLLLKCYLVSFVSKVGVVGPGIIPGGRLIGLCGQIQGHLPVIPAAGPCGSWSRKTMLLEAGSLHCIMRLRPACIL